MATSSVTTATSPSRSAFEVDAPFLVRERRVLGRAQEIVRAALVDQRIGPEACRHLGAAGLADQLDVVDVGAAVHPVMRARQWRHRRGRVEGEGAGRGARLELCGQRGELRRQRLPVVERPLHRAGNAVGAGGPGEVAADHGQPAVPRPVMDRRQLHLPLPFQLFT